MKLLFVAAFVALLVFVAAEAEADTPKLAQEQQILDDSEMEELASDEVELALGDSESDWAERKINLCSNRVCKGYCLQRGYRQGKCKSRRSTKCLCSKRLI